MTTPFGKTINFDITEDNRTIHFKDAYYSPNNVNTYVPAIYTANHTSIRPEIAVGEYVTPNGGTFKALQRYYAQFNWDLDSNSYEGQFDVELNTTIDFGSGPVPLSMSTKYGTLSRCKQVEGYHPLYGSFNVERHNSTGTPEEKYPLYTQVVGKDFDFDVVAYSKDPAPAYQTELILDDITVAVELINARSFQDENATFLCDNPDPAIIQTLDTSGNKEIFAEFQNSSRVDLSPRDISVDTALRSAAFRVWYITDGNNTIVPHNCTNRSDDSCFQNLYDTWIASTDTTLQASGTHGFCSVETIGGNGCSDYVNQKTGARGCYACLRDFFSRPVCSRDNFAIRPAAYRVSISDGDEQPTPTTVKMLGANDQSDNSPVASLAAGYQYKLDANATSYLGDQVIARGYTRLFDNDDPTKLSAMLNFNDKTTCFDKNNTKWGVFFQDGSLYGIWDGSRVDYDPGYLVSHENVGIYSYKLHDSDWTLVDQARYPYKTFPNVNDCLPSQNDIATDGLSKSGCDIDTKLINNTGITNPIYNDLSLRFHPYAFGLSDIIFSVEPDSSHLFMTDLSDPYYQTADSLNNRMSNIYEGNVTALAKTGVVTTNFTTGCAATDVTLAIGLSSQPDQDTLSIQGVDFQKTLQYGSALDLKTTYDDIQIGADKNLTLSKNGFEDSIEQGRAHIRVYTTFKKPRKLDLLPGTEGIDPIAVNYKEINASSPDANSSADLTMHIPEGNKGFDKNVTFYYARVVPNEPFYPRVEEDYKNTPLSIVVYSSYGSALSQTKFDLNGSASSITDLSSNWYFASNLFDNDADLGTSNLVISYYKGKSNKGYIQVGTPPFTTFTPDAQKIDDMTYSAVSGRQLDLHTYIKPDTLKPVTFQIDYTSSPWLEYEDEQYFRVRFIPKASAWTGYGKTGHVVGTEDEKDDDINFIKTKRLEW